MQGKETAVWKKRGRWPLRMRPCLRYDPGRESVSKRKISPETVRLGLAFRLWLAGQLMHSAKNGEEKCREFVISLIHDRLWISQ